MSAWRRRAKWAVYFLLFVNFLFYLHEDATYAQYVLDAGSSPREVLAAYVTSIDLVAWFTLIILFELESCARGGRPWEGAARWGVGVLRLLCYAVILHTSFANLVALAEFRHPDRLPPAADVCAYAGGWSLLRNRDYVSIDAENCGTLARGPELFALSGDRVLTDREGLAEGTLLAWSDAAESLAWLLIVLLTEAALRLARRGPQRQAQAAAALRVKLLPYLLILAIAAYWGAKAQWLYLWDELLWVLGFRVIDGNLRDWPRFARRFSPSPSGA